MPPDAAAMVAEFEQMAMQQQGRAAHMGPVPPGPMGAPPPALAQNLKV